MSLDFNMRDLCAAPVSLRLSLALGSGRNCVFMLGICGPSCAHFRTQINSHTDAAETSQANTHSVYIIRIRNILKPNWTRALHQISE